MSPRGRWAHEEEPTRTAHLKKPTSTNTPVRDPNLLERARKNELTSSQERGYEEGDRARGEALTRRDAINNWKTYGDRRLRAGADEDGPDDEYDEGPSVAVVRVASRTSSRERGARKTSLLGRTRCEEEHANHRETSDLTKRQRRETSLPESDCVDSVSFLFCFFW